MAHTDTADPIAYATNAYAAWKLGTLPATEAADAVTAAAYALELTELDVIVEILDRLAR